MNRDLEESLNNAYLVRRRLSGLVKLKGEAYYRLDVGHFNIRMYTNAEYSDPKNKELSSLMAYKAVTVEVWEDQPTGSAVGKRNMINLAQDYRFSEIWKELKWTEDEFEWMHGILAPIHVVCDLIKHTDRIVELTPFH